MRRLLSSWTSSAGSSPELLPTETNTAFEFSFKSALPTTAKHPNIKVEECSSDELP
jgi:hypothetical protein